MSEPEMTPDDAFFLASLIASNMEAAAAKGAIFGVLPDSHVLASQAAAIRRVLADLADATARAERAERERDAVVRACVFRAGGRYRYAIGVLSGTATTRDEAEARVREWVAALGDLGAAAARLDTTTHERSDA